MINKTGEVPEETVNLFEMTLEEHVSGNNIFWSTLIGKSRERKVYHLPHCPFESK